MTREEAIKELRGFIGQLTEGCQEAIKVLIPELKESVDENIRKSIVETIKQCTDILEPKNQKRMLAWLEKQKEQKPAEWSDTDNIGWDEAFACVTRAEKAAKNEEELQNAVTAEKWLKEIKFKYYVHPVKQEWSEEDSSMLCDIVGYITGIGSSSGITKQERVDFLYGLPERFNLQPKQEWSEEDEAMRDNILRLLSCFVCTLECDSNPSLSASYPAYQKEIDWLKSLRPQLHKETYQAVKHDLAIKFINYLDNNKPEGKMCLSNGECEDIDKAFKENDWAKIIRYAKKYQIQSEKKPEVKLTGWVARDKNGEIYVYGDYPEKDSERPIWIGSNSINLYQESFPNLKWEDEPMEVEITIRKNNTL